ncbi:argininosuccinate lyase [Acuticoccus sp. M5D2P5]|uniref:argininosuccinate lyase n=1 Tax=Acuticoccus kalidii TaxID=2910977 RepID=UPI001F31C842|nr:argininosuccinate lyase [Acuticoccus kalidii]MCF3935196.1 argininosuccinate lyase [Acuticoccus kalidii]
MNAPSKVSGFLSEALAPEIIEGLYKPLLERTFAPSLPAFTAINRAHIVMLAEAGLMPGDVAADLLRTVDALAAEGPAAFTLDGEREDAYFNYEAEVFARIGQTAGWLHMARSRNDLKSTADRLRARDLAERLYAGTLALREALIARAAPHFATVMTGYTHLQHAQPITWGWYLLGIEAGLRRDSARIADALDRLDECPLGAGAQAGTGFPIDRERTARLLGFERAHAHPLDAVANRDGLNELAYAATSTATTTGRMAQDFYLMATFEFGTLAFPDRIAITSSIMPQKKNLAVLEHLKARPAVLLGALTTAVGAARSVPFGHSQEVGAEATRWVWDALGEYADLLSIARIVVEAAEPKVERMAELAGANFATATALADSLVAHGMTFRAAHHVVGRFVRLSLEGRPLSPVDRIAEAAREVGEDCPPLDAAAIERALDPAGIITQAAGSGPSLVQSERLSAAAEAALAADRQRLDAWHARRAEAAAALDAAAAHIVTANEAAP